MTPVQFVRGVGPQRRAAEKSWHRDRERSAVSCAALGVNDFSDLRPVPKLEADLEQSVHGFVVDRDVRQLTKG